MQIFPADDGIDVNALLEELTQCGYIIRYTVEKNKYIQIVNFEKHQSPHVKERASTIPAPDKHDANTSLTPPDSHDSHDSHDCGKKPIEPSADGSAKKTKTEYTPAFEELWKSYPKREGGNPKKSAFKAYTARLRAGATHDEIADGVTRYAAHIRAKGKEGTEFVKQGATFFGPDEHFREHWSSLSGTSPRKREFDALCEGAL